MSSWQGQLSLFSPAQHQNSTRTTLLFSHHSYSSQGLLTSLLISLNVLWFGQYVFTVWAKNAEAITLLEASLVRLNWGRSSELFLLCESYTYLWIRLIPDKSCAAVTQSWGSSVSILIWPKHFLKINAILTQEKQCECKGLCHWDIVTMYTIVFLLL